MVINRFEEDFTAYSKMSSQVDYQWAYTIMDSSRVSTFLISILLIVYGSFRSLNMEQEAREREKEKSKSSNGSSVCLTDISKRKQDVQTLDTMQALCLPLGASISLLVMFFFFDSMQMLFAICTAMHYLLLPLHWHFSCCLCVSTLLILAQMEISKFTFQNTLLFYFIVTNIIFRISFGICGRFTTAELLSFSMALFIVCIWVLTGHWLLMDAMGMGLCVAFIAFVRLPSLKVSTLLLTGLLIYDVFWVFFSSYIFNTNVMVKVATRSAENPVGVVARKLHIGGVAKEAPRLSLPGKLVFPSIHNGRFSMLGLGDIVMPGLLLCFVMRYDAYKKSQLLHFGETGVPPPRHLGRIRQEIILLLNLNVCEKQ
ncbi:hypothetical protein AGLY_000285 [Aphis glycines]|uniref:Signal peptide peptidase-like 3 n=1 Tax=Aphis glycines TaxID=307491 RepID=A0A6G0U722_APHGL|nr:hypothetical protein AGLY_000285 [Aphis glycines]